MSTLEQIREALRQNGSINYKELDHQFFPFAKEEEDGYHDFPHQIAFAVYPKVPINDTNEDKISFARSLVPALEPYDVWAPAGVNTLHYGFREPVGSRVIETVVDDLELRKHQYSEKLSDGQTREVRTLYRTIELRVVFLTSFEEPVQWQLQKQ